MATKKIEQAHTQEMENREQVHTQEMENREQLVIHLTKIKSLMGPMNNHILAVPANEIRDNVNKMMLLLPL
jgi:hypothetical protein